MKTNSLFVFLLLWFSFSHAQEKEPWSRINTETTNRVVGKSDGKEAVLFQLNETILKTKLKIVEDKSILNASVVITIPNADGVLEKFSIHEDSNFEPELQAKYPEIRSYSGVGITDATAVLNFSMSPSGIQTMITRNGNQLEFIEKHQENKEFYVVFDSKDNTKERLPFSCTTIEKANVTNKSSRQSAKLVSSNKTFRTLRLALSCTGEYAQYHGGTVNDALSAMNATITRVNGIYNRDLAVKLLLIANNDQIIYTDAAADPYSIASLGVGTQDVPGRWSTELQDNLTTVIGSDSYDIGHLFGATGGGGNAGCIGCVCDADKGSAYTSPSNNRPEGDAFDIDFVAHEIGHQLGANHTFSHELEGTGVNVEPGSGSTIMGYAGITTDYDVELRSSDYFSFASISQIQNNLATKDCPVSTVISADEPVVNAGQDYTIPKGTAFVLKGTGGISPLVSYVWEQNDSATSTSGDASVALSTKPNGPLFRSFPPASTPIRYMPSFENVMAGRLRNRWESVSDVARTLHFVLTARDNASEGFAQTISDEMIVNVSAAVGPFEVTSQNIENLSWFQDTNEVVTWSVNGTNSLAGAATVNIKLSIDNGLTFPITLASAVANDGSETITVPEVWSRFCRIMIEPTNNIFYAVNSKVFAIGYLVESNCQTYDFQTPFSIPEQGNFAGLNTAVPSSDSYITDVNINTVLSHEYFSDIQMELVSPEGTVVRLFYNGCGTTNGQINVNFDDAGSSLSCGTATLQTVAPLGILANFNGEKPEGDWSLRIRDIFSNDMGTLDAASLSVCTQVYTLVSDDDLNSNLKVSSKTNDGNFNVNFISTSSETELEVLVYDTSGKRIFEKKYPNNGGFSQDIQLPNVPEAGIYFVVLVDGSVKKTAKMIVN